MDATSLERDPGLRPQIWEFPTNLQDEIRRAYLKAGPYQPKLSEYPFSGIGNQHRRFQFSWFQRYSNWLEYSPSKNAIFCLPCYIFAKKSTGRPGSDVFTIKGFDYWKKVNDGMNCPLIGHVGRDPNSPHKNAVKCCEDLMNQSRHIDKLVEKQVSQDMENNRLRLKTSIESVRWLTFQACAFRGHDESSDSKNQDNFIKLIKILASYNDQVNEVVLKNAPQNAKYTSPKIQKEILHIFANNVRNVIREKIGDAKFCILVDEARDESKREQMAIILRFVDKDALVAASRETKHVHRFFVHLTSIINIVVGSSKRHDELQSAQAAEIESLIASNEIETGKGANQIGTLQRAGDTRWGSHFQSICSLMRMFSATCSVINTISNEGSNYSQRGDAEAAYMVLTSFEFILILYMMKKIMGITNALCQSLQQNFQDIVNAMSLVSTTKMLIQNLRDDGWESLLTDVILFCEKHQIDIPDMNGQYTRARGKSRHLVDKSMEHHFMIDIFTATIDFQLLELNNRFNENTMELLILSAALSPKGAYKSFKIDDICKLVEKFYPQDFTEQEKFLLRIQLQHYELDVLMHLDFQDMSTLSELCRELAISEKSKIYYLIDRLIRLVLTLPFSTATTEGAFSAMKLIKIRLRTRMEDEFLADHLLVYIEEEIAKNFTSEMIMNEFYSMKDRRRA
ncbi:hypothetical protein F2P56_033965 [Juglans regia]|uniref:TTF-type domain-containing protein n=1 Tax=Juglans regia TaxID=51240 RepID=A0A833U134_JUGRE|nr:hypothetical protein F2P56_033965 [Juglans regia]